jgi:transposase
MSTSIRIARKRSAPGILASPGMVFGMRCSAWPSRGKKTAGYTERDPLKRKAYLRLRERYRRRGKNFVYIDESGFAPCVSRRYAYAPKGRRAPGLILGTRRPRTSLLAARIGNTLEAPLLFTGTCDTLVFNLWLEKELCPFLNDTHVVVMDNVPFHKSAKTKTLITAKGATLLFLPPYSPALNPIERDFAIIKKLREYHEHETLEHIIKTYK